MKRLAILALVGMALGANAQIWNEVGDAGELVGTAQVPVGAGALVNINGILNGQDADLYCVVVTDPHAFMASTSAANGGGAGFDSQLFLFNTNGTGITMDDDDPAGGLQSTVTGLGSLTAGQTILVGISEYDRDPLNAAGAQMWLDGPFNQERFVDGAGGVLSGWDANGDTGGEYRIALRGATYCVPEPASMVALTLGALGLIARRRRRS